MAQRSLLSGRPGIPEGAFKMLGDREVERAIGFIVQNITNLEQVINIVEGSGGTFPWIRFNAAGTKLAGNSTGNVLTVSREAEGIYLITASEGFTSSGGFSQYGVLALPSAASGDGGEGVSQYRAFDGYEVVATDNTVNVHFEYRDADETFYVLGPAADDVFKHADATFTSTPTQIDTNGQPIQTATPPGGLDREQLRLWFSPDNVFHLQTMQISDNAFTDFGTLGSDQRYTTGSNQYGANGYRLWLSGGSHVFAYDPNIATATLGGAVFQYSNIGSNSKCLPAIWDDDGYIWILQGSNLRQLSPTSNSFWSHAYPYTGSVGNASRAVFDSLHRRIYALIPNATSGRSELWYYQNWTNESDNSGLWTKITDLGSGSTDAALWYDAETDTLFVSDYQHEQVHRFVGEPKTRLDTVSVDNQTPDNSQVDYDLDSAFTCFYKKDYGYVSGQKGGVEYLIKISYNGAGIGLGSGGSVVSSVLVALYEIISATQAYVYVFRQISPPIYTDAECTVSFPS